MKKAVLFDLDGTLCNSLPDIRTAGNISLARLGFPPHTLEEYRTYIGNGVVRLIESMLADYPHTPEQQAEVLEIYRKELPAHSLDETAPYPGIPELLTALKKLGILTAVISNKPMETTRKVISHLFPEETFDYVYGAMDPLPLKPKPEPVCHVLEKLGVRSEDALLVGDSEVDILTGQNARVDTVGVLWGFRSENVLREAGAGLLIDAPEKLLKLL